MTDRLYALEFSREAKRHLRKLPRDVGQRIRAATERLRVDPRPHGAKALVGMAGRLRIRVGDYRVIYHVIDERIVVYIHEIGHRREVYRR